MELSIIVKKSSLEKCTKELMGIQNLLLSSEARVYIVISRIRKM